MAHRNDSYATRILLLTLLCAAGALAKPAPTTLRDQVTKDASRVDGFDVSRAAVAHGVASVRQDRLSLSLEAAQPYAAMVGFCARFGGWKEGSSWSGNMTADDVETIGELHVSSAHGYAANPGAHEVVLSFGDGQPTPQKMGMVVLLPPR